MPEPDDKNGHQPSRKKVNMTIFTRKLLQPRSLLFMRAGLQFIVPILVALQSGYLASTVHAAGVKSPAANSYAVDFKEHKLANGLRVILVEDHSAPTLSICLTYDVGSRNEVPGRTGFAHLFEHMLFQGSENVGKGEHFLLVQNNGGRANATTSSDRTNYFQTLPANQLELAIFLEADRMRAPEITQANFDNQRKTVQEERRQRVDNRPYGQTFEVILDTVFDKFPYKHSTIGSMADLNAATVKDAREFFDQYYGPNNAVLSLVGDFDSTRALALIKKYFGPIHARPTPPPPDVIEPEQRAERRRTIEDGFARSPRIDIVYKVPPGNTRDWYALAVLGRVISSGSSSRLHQKFVKEKELALSAEAEADELRGTSLFWFGITARPEADLAEIERWLEEEITRLQSEPISDWELDKVRMQLMRRRAEILYSTRGRANSLGHYAVYYNDPQLINTIWDKYAAVTKADLQRVAQMYLKPTNRTVVTTLPKKSENNQSRRPKTK